jgi:menaquinone-dependent protoporphyrinogen IX oxidase
MKILIVHDAREGSVVELCMFMKRQAERMNRRVVVFDAAGGKTHVGEFDAAVVVAEIKDSQWSENIRNYIDRNASALNIVPSFFLLALPFENENRVDVTEEDYQPIDNPLITLSMRRTGRHSKYYFCL